MIGTGICPGGRGTLLRVVVVWGIVMAPGMVALGQGRPVFNPTFDLSTLRPFTEGAVYLDKYETRLYPGSNEIPAAHQEAGVRVAGTIQPLDVDGKPDAGKGVTVITGLALDREGLAKLATELKQRCGAGGTVKGSTIEIQGDHRDLLVQELQRRGTGMGSGVRRSP